MGFKKICQNMKHDLKHVKQSHLLKFHLFDFCNFYQTFDILGFYLDYFDVE